MTIEAISKISGGARDEGFYKFFKKFLVVSETIDLNISWLNNFSENISWPLPSSASSLSKYSKFLILKFLVKYCKLHSVFKSPSKSHMLDCSYKL